MDPTHVFTWDTEDARCAYCDCRPGGYASLRPCTEAPEVQRR